MKEVLEVSPNLKGVVMTSATNKFVVSTGTMHIVGELRNDGTKTLNVNQMVASIYGLNNQTLGLDRATPTPATLSPGQSASFEFFVGGDQALDGISDLSQITKVKYHVGL
ncbi:MAG: FxLYD domain-containing protein [Nitrososphaeraceae archaeon]